MRLRVTIALAAALFASSAGASCFGSGSFRTCTDSSGNNYTVQRFGGTTYMQGSNPSTGSMWSQQSHRFGNTTNVYGSDSSGRSWNNTIQVMPGGTVQQFGSDSSGRPFSRTCNQFGCF